MAPPKLFCVGVSAGRVWDGVVMMNLWPCLESGVSSISSLSSNISSTSSTSSNSSIIEIAMIHYY